ncbi:MAG: hypothetical protein Q9212_002006 [Teloschistes hypoglaucus]
MAGSRSTTDDGRERQRLADRGKPRAGGLDKWKVLPNGWALPPGTPTEDAGSVEICTTPSAYKDQAHLRPTVTSDETRGLPKDRRIASGIIMLNPITALASQ